MRWLDPFVTPDADRLAPADIDAAAAAYRAWLQAL
jgi:hypothetical protein